MYIYIYYIYYIYTHTHTHRRFCKDIKIFVGIALRANFVQLLQFHCLFSVRFHFGYCLRQSPHLF